MATFEGVADKLRNERDEAINLMTRQDERQHAGAAWPEGNSKPCPPNALSPGSSLRERVRKATRQIESEIIIEALERHRWNRRRTASS